MGKELKVGDNIVWKWDNVLGYSEHNLGLVIKVHGGIVQVQGVDGLYSYLPIMGIDWQDWPA